MTLLLIYAISLFGFCYIIGQSKLTLASRRWTWKWLGTKLAKCPHCGKKMVWSDAVIPNTRFGDTQLAAVDCKFCKKLFGQDETPTLIGWLILLIECPACLSTWIGLALSMWLPHLTASIAGPDFGRLVPFACLSCGLSAIIGLITGVMEV